MINTKPYLNTSHHINCNGRLVDVSQPMVMGILNITPDSFYDGGKYKYVDNILERVDQMLSEGADIIDIGAYSSRPGAKDISTNEELDRLKTALEPIRNKYPDILISIDTFRAEVAKYVVENYKVDIINDISAGDMDDKMLETVAKLNVPYIIMHMKGTPQSMQVKPEYEKDVIFEVIDYLAAKVKRLSHLGVHDVIVDPGFGFGKTLAHNYEILKRLEEFKILEKNILVGVSRKSMIYNLLGSTPAEALNGTTALNMMALERGAKILRVHDVKEAKECVTIYKQLFASN